MYLHEAASQPTAKSQELQGLGAEFLSQMRPVNAEWSISNA